jgi:hypothetical protein
MAGYKVIATGFSDPGFYQDQQQRLAMMLSGLSQQAEQRKQAEDEQEQQEMKQVLSLIQDTSLPPDARASMANDLSVRYGEKYPWIKDLASSLGGQAGARQAIAQQWQDAGTSFQKRLSDLTTTQQQQSEVLQAAPDEVPHDGGAAVGTIPNVAKIAGQQLLQQQTSPFWRAYGELTPPAQAMVAAYYKQQGLGDQVPFPDYSRMNPQIAQVAAMYGTSSPQYQAAIQSSTGLSMSAAEKQKLDLEDQQTTQQALAAHGMRQQEHGQIASDARALQAQRAADSTKLAQLHANLQLSTGQQLIQDRAAARPAGTTGAATDINSFYKGIEPQVKSFTTPQQGPDGTVAPPMSRRDAVARVVGQNVPELQQAFTDAADKISTMPLPDAIKIARVKKLHDTIASSLLRRVDPWSLAAHVRQSAGLPIAQQPTGPQVPPAPDVSQPMMQDQGGEEEDGQQ